MCSNGLMGNMGEMGKGMEKGFGLFMFWPRRDV